MKFFFLSFQVTLRKREKNTYICEIQWGYKILYDNSITLDWLPCTHFSLLLNLPQLRKFKFNLFSQVHWRGKLNLPFLSLELILVIDFTLDSIENHINIWNGCWITNAAPHITYWNSIQTSLLFSRAEINLRHKYRCGWMFSYQVRQNILWMHDMLFPRLKWSKMHMLRELIIANFQLVSLLFTE